MNKFKIDICRKHGETEFTFSNNRWRCKKCWIEWDRNKRHRLKQKLVDYKGGKCEICGYNKCLNALDFHHIHKETKLFELNASNFGKSWNILKQEADKCKLLCANCHRELHYNENESRRKRFIQEHIVPRAYIVDTLNYDKIFNDFKQGLYQQEIAEKYNVSLASVKRFMQKHNITKKHININCDEILILCKENPTYTYLSSKLGYSVTAIKRFCLKNNLVKSINQIRQDKGLPLLNSK